MSTSQGRSRSNLKRLEKTQIIHGGVKKELVNKIQGPQSRLTSSRGPRHASATCVTSRVHLHSKLNTTIPPLKYPHEQFQRANTTKIQPKFMIVRVQVYTKKRMTLVHLQLSSNPPRTPHLSLSRLTTTASSLQLPLHSLAARSYSQQSSHPRPSSPAQD